MLSWWNSFLLAIYLKLIYMAGVKIGALSNVTTPACVVATTNLVLIDLLFLGENLTILKQFWW